MPSGKITGGLTRLGTANPVTMDVTFNKIAPHPVSSNNGVIMVGFSARAQVERIDYGMTYAQGGIGDVLGLYTEVEGHRR